MSTKFAKPLEASQVTHVADMPPLEVVTEGIPAQEHMGSAPPTQVQAPPTREGWGRMWAWALAGVMGLLLVAAGVFTFTQLSSTGTLDLTPPAGQEVPTEVQATEPGYAGPLLGAALPYIPDWSIPSIASIPEMSIASMPDMSIPTFPSIAAMSIPSIASIPEMSIPAMPDMAIPSIPATTPATPTQATPTMLIPSISFPTFPSIASISVPSIPAFPSISIPSFPSIPDM